MTDDTTPHLLKAIQASLSTLDRKIGVMSQSLNSIRVDQHTHGEQLSRVRDDIQTIAIAIDEHGHRLGALEDRLASIESHLPTTRQ